MDLPWQVHRLSCARGRNMELIARLIAFAALMVGSILVLRCVIASDLVSARPVIVRKRRPHMRSAPALKRAA